MGVHCSLRLPTSLRGDDDVILVPYTLSKTKLTSCCYRSQATTQVLYILKYLPTIPSSHTSLSRNDGPYPNDSQDPLITHRSSAANTATAIQTGYLLSTIPSLLAEARLYGRRPSKTILAHHAGIGSAPLALQYYILRRKERGIYIITMLLADECIDPGAGSEVVCEDLPPAEGRSVESCGCGFRACFLGREGAAYAGGCGRLWQRVLDGACGDLLSRVTVAL